MAEGITGFVVDNIPAAVQAVERISQLDRARCRAYFEQHFTATRMAKDYVQTYRALLKGAAIPSMQEVVPRLQPALEESLE